MDRQPKIHWTEAQRVFLLFSNRAFDLNPSELAKVFCLAVANELKADGFSKRQYPAASFGRRLMSQYHELQRKKSTAFHIVHTETAFKDLS